MQGNFSYYNPTKLYFGETSLDFLKDELKNYGDTVLGLLAVAAGYYAFSK